jgi:hypothetical protein
VNKLTIVRKMNDISASFRGVLVSLTLITVIGIFSSCEKYTYSPPEVDPDEEWNLSTDIQPLFNANCVTCHGGIVTPDLRSGQSHNSLTSGNYVDAPAETSRLYVKITTDSDHEKLLTETDKLRILYWIEQGAENN